MQGWIFCKYDIQAYWNLRRTNAYLTFAELQKWHHQ